MTSTATHSLILPTAAAAAGEHPLLPLREELSLHPGPRLDDGAPSWTLQDPVNNRFFRIGWLEFEILSRWQLASPRAIIEAVQRDTPLQVDNDEIDRLLDFLARHDLVQMRGPKAMQRLLDRKHAGRGNLFWFLLKNYLFFRIPLIRPDRFIERTAPLIAPLCSPVAIWLYAGCALTGVILALRQWDQFVNSFTYFFSLEGLLLMVLAIAATKILHEFGHAYTAKRHGCRVPSMGIAFMVLWPVLFTDASDAWKLRSKRQRLAIGAGGIGVELAIASLALLSWTFLADGIWRSLAFLLATSTWIVTLLINLNPFMRFDGYYLLADALGVANLQDRAFALGRWFLREQLFGFGDPAPEDVPLRRRRLLIGYAFGTWLYRFFLFLGIAVMVYYLFFKLLGIFLMLVEIAWFIGRPISNELRIWWQRRVEMTWNRRTLRLVALVLLGTFLLGFPWRGTISAAALWRADNYARVFAAQAGQVSQVVMNTGETVQAGETLLQLDSPDHDFALANGRQRIATLTWAVETTSFDLELKEQRRVLRQELQSELAAQRARLAEHEQLSVRTPLAGRVAERLDPLRAGDWLGTDELLAVIVAPGKGSIEALVAEEHLLQVEVGSRGRFYPDDLGRPSFAVTVKEIDPTNVHRLTEPYLASVHGGKVAVRVVADGELIPETPVYRLLLAADEDLPAPGQIVTGSVRLQGERRSLLARSARSILAVLIRESGF